MKIHCATKYVLYKNAITLCNEICFVQRARKESIKWWLLTLTKTIIVLTLMENGIQKCDLRIYQMVEPPQSRNYVVQIYHMAAT